jgi:hypothetical protein
LFCTADLDAITAPEDYDEDNGGGQEQTEEESMEEESVRYEATSFEGKRIHVIYTICLLEEIVCCYII